MNALLPTKTIMRTDTTLTTERKTPYNSTFAIGGVSCSADSFVVAESSVLRMKFSGKNPAFAKQQNVGNNVEKKN